MNTVVAMALPKRENAEAVKNIGVSIKTAAMRIRASVDPHVKDRLFILPM